MKLQIVSTSRPTEDSISLLFRKTEGLQDYRPGQHALLSVKVGNEVFKRSYSFHTSPYDGETVGITVRKITNGIVSGHLQNHDGNSEIFLDGIEGDFTLQPSRNMKRQLVMFAGGSGITPIMSMIKAVLSKEPASAISLVYSNRSHSTVIFRDELTQLAQRYPGRLQVFHVLTRPENTPADFPVFYNGRLSRLIAKKLLKSILSEINHDVEFFLCGPHDFMKVAEESIRAVKPERAKIHKEHFFLPDNETFNPSLLADRDVVLQAGSRDIVVPVKGGRSILQAGLESGIALPYSCTEGQCGTCRATLISGEVRMRRNHILAKEELDAGQILLCQGFPLSAGVIIKARI